jgi:hypothetical protein
MAKAKNLAGLAALGALGYMLTRDKPSENAGDQKTSSYTGDTKKVEALEDAFVPTNESSYARSNTGTPMRGVGDATNNPLPKASVKQRLSPAAVADNTTGITVPTGSPDAEAGKTRGRPKAKPSVSSSAEGMKNYKPRYTPSAAAPKTTTAPASPKKPYMPEEVDMGYKKGGKIKKMASGGMTASRRADGIASRGKTKCKMY